MFVRTVDDASCRGAAAAGAARARCGSAGRALAGRGAFLGSPRDGGAARSACGGRAGVFFAAGLAAAALFAALALRRLPLRRALLAAAAALDRLRPFVRVRLEARDDLARHFAPDHLLDVGEQRLVVRAHEGDRLAGGARAAGAADPVDIVFRHVGQVEVDDVRQLLDVEAARGDVGGDERLQLAGLELARAHGCARSGSCCRGSPARSRRAC